MKNLEVILLVGFVRRKRFRATFVYPQILIKVSFLIPRMISSSYMWNCDFDPFQIGQSRYPVTWLFGLVKSGIVRKLSQSTTQSYLLIAILTKMNFSEIPVKKLGFYTNLKYEIQIGNINIKCLIYI